MMKFALAASVMALGAVSAQAATTGAILAQGSDGNIYSVNVSTAEATLFRSLSSFGGTSPNSPNSLGTALVDGEVVTFRTDFFNTTGTNELRRDDTLIATLTSPENSGGVAAGDVSGGVFSYITGSGEFGTVSNIFGAPSDAVVSDLQNVIGIDQEAIFGDLAIRSDFAYVSWDTSFGILDLATLTMSDVSTPILSGSLENETPRFAGLAFDGDILYGFTARAGDSLDNWLYSIALDAPGTWTASFIGEIALDGVLLTDAAPLPIPLPAAAWMLLSALAGMGWLGAKRRAA